jgi:hypothetical protein
LAQLLLQLLLSRDVPEDAKEQRRLAWKIDERIRRLQLKAATVPKRCFLSDKRLPDTLSETLTEFLKSLLPIRLGVDQCKELAFQLLTWFADQAAISFIDLADNPFSVCQAHPIQGSFPDQAELQIGSPLFILGPEALGYVTHDDGIKLPTLDLGPRKSRLKWKFLAISSDTAASRLDQLCHGCGRVFRPVLCDRLQLSGDESGNGLADGFAGRATEHLFGCWIEKSNAAISLGDDDGILCRMDYGSQASLGFRQMLLGPHLPQGAGDYVR